MQGQSRRGGLPGGRRAGPGSGFGGRRGQGSDRQPNLFGSAPAANIQSQGIELARRMGPVPTLTARDLGLNITPTGQVNTLDMFNVIPDIMGNRATVFNPEALRIGQPNPDADRNAMATLNAMTSAESITPMRRPTTAVNTFMNQPSPFQLQGITNTSFGFNPFSLGFANPYDDESTTEIDRLTENITNLYDQYFTPELIFGDINLGELEPDIDDDNIGFTITKPF